MKTPVGQTEPFQQTWQALMRQLETVLSIAHQREPNPTQTAEAVTGRKSSFYLLIMIRRT